MARHPIPSKRASRITIPQRAHPHAKLLFGLMQSQGKTYEEVSHYSGVLVSTIKAWRKNNRPGLETLESCFGYLGWRYMPVPEGDQLPSGIREAIDALAVEYGEREPLIGQLMASVCRAPMAAAATEQAPKRRKPRGPVTHPEQVALFDEPALEQAA